MGLNDIIALLYSICILLAFISLFCRGDGSQISLKTLQLMFIAYILKVPMSSEMTISAIVFYAITIAFFIWIFYSFHSGTFSNTYTGENDKFCGHWLLFLPAAAVPILMLFFLPNGLMQCTPSTYEYIILPCTTYILWITGFCLTPLAFIPQLALVRRMTSTGKPVMINVTMFITLMAVAAGLGFFYHLFYSGRSAFQLAAMITNALTFLTLGGYPWLVWCFCRKKAVKEDEVEDTGDIEGSPKVASSPATNREQSFTSPGFQVTGSSPAPFATDVAPAPYVEDVNASNNSTRSAKSEVELSNKKKGFFSNPFGKKSSKGKEEASESEEVPTTPAASQQNATTSWDASWLS